MRPSRSPAAGDARAAFHDAARHVRAHALIRQWSVPFDELEALVPRTGDVLDYGCGTGLFAIQLACASADRRVYGVDVSPYRVAQARTGARSAGVADRTEFDVIDDAWHPPPDAYDAVVICDVLYLLAPEAIERTVADAARALRPGGTVVIKEVSAVPRWKHRTAHLQELLSVRVLRWTKGDRLNLLPLGTAARVLGTGGLSPHHVPLDRGYPYSHDALVARRAAP